jgi:hypothetical protein
MSTKEKINHLERLLRSNNCPNELITPYAMQLLLECKNYKKSVYDIQLIKY